MILNQKQTTVAYRCPHCGTAVVSPIGAFLLNADMLRLKCPCGESEMTVLYTADKKVRLSVPCFLCPKPHSFTVSESLFFSSDILHFPCSYAGLDIAFVGQTETVDAALKAAQEELSSLLGEASFADLSRESRGGGAFSDPQILDIVMYVLRELHAEGEIRCRCADQDGDFSVEIRDDSVHIECKRCGAAADIAADSTVSANAFLHCTHIDLV